MLKVSQTILILTSGIIWTCIGILLISIASRWFHLLTNLQLITSLSLGVIIGTLFATFGLSRLAKKNITRISNFPEKASIFAFQRGKTYFLILLMISLGMFMRNTSYVPKFVLTPIYLSMGLGLLIASFYYYKQIISSRHLAASIK
ncbi:MAG: hypothetical protein HN353_13375 [Bdellovibrionales bacterium]|nr:hypothetical protein [Bdellovibrionales bacterium]MBT3524917.1 hypothetical protein [Bdellovibrionales bacterium]MBT7668062.1 hypothetical protein [Bdellovibrionales bacterium]MBT7767458.1 hypothetical protein [Bdellovibrionales bacterium]